MTKETKKYWVHDSLKGNLDSYTKDFFENSSVKEKAIVYEVGCLINQLYKAERLGNLKEIQHKIQEIRMQSVGMISSELKIMLNALEGTLENAIYAAIVPNYCTYDADSDISQPGSPCRYDINSEDEEKSFQFWNSASSPDPQFVASDLLRRLAGVAAFNKFIAEKGLSFDNTQAGSKHHRRTHSVA